MEHIYVYGQQLLAIALRHSSLANTRALIVPPQWQGGGFGQHRMHACSCHSAAPHVHGWYTLVPVILWTLLAEATSLDAAARQVRPPISTQQPATACWVSKECAHSRNRSTPMHHSIMYNRSSSLQKAGNADISRLRWISLYHIARLGRALTCAREQQRFPGRLAPSTGRSEHSCSFQLGP